MVMTVGAVVVPAVAIAVKVIRKMVTQLNRSRTKLNS